MLVPLVTVIAILTSTGKSKDRTPLNFPTVLNNEDRGTDDDPSPELRKRSLAMLHEALESQHSFELLRQLVTVAPGRLAGTPAQDRAIEWGLSTMRALGLENVRAEPVEVSQWIRGSTCDVALKNSSGDVPLAATALGGSVGTPESGIEAEVIEVHSFGQLRSLGREKVEGRIVFYNRPFDLKFRNTFRGYSSAVGQRSTGAIEAAKLGAVAALVRSVTSCSDDHPHTGAMRYAPEVTKIPAVAISVVAANLLSERLAADSSLKVHVKLDCETGEPKTNANVIGEIRGTTHPEQIVLIGGHLDSWDICQGAHDDGAGIAHCLEAARLIKKTGAAPKRTIRVVLYANEENGLAGGRNYAKVHADELDQHVLAIETDAGGFAPRSFGVKGGPDLVSAFGTLDKLLKLYDLGGVTVGGGGADISTLGPSGVPLMGLKPDDHRYFDLHHSVKDDLSQVHPRELSLGAAALAMAAFQVADQADAPPRTR